MELNEREAHCVARLLQGAIFGKDITDGCAYCKFRCESPILAGEIRKRLTDETGVDLGVMDSGKLPRSDFPHGRFLMNAHEDSKKAYRKAFDHISELCGI